MPLSAETFTINLYVALASPLVGSAIAAGAARFASGKPWNLTPSACPSCGRRLGVLELIPIVSWVALRGKCRGCAAAIPASYPLIELSAVAVAVWAWLATPPHVFAATCVLGWLLLALAAIDIRTRRLPDVLNLVLAACGLGVAALLDRERLLDHVLGMALGYGALVVVEIAYRQLRGRDGLGRGDAKLLGAVGAWVGPMGLPGCILIGAGGAIGFLLFTGWASDRRVTSVTSIAFGPFIALGGWVTWIYGPLLF